MKRKSIFLLGTILAGAALVGGTFAAWAVTDNASPFNVKITPGTLDVGGNKAVTLEWGTKGLVDIQEIAMGEERGPYVVGLKATTSDSSGFTGNLALCLSTTSAASEKLINYLDVKVYSGVEKGLKEKENPTDPDVENDPILSIYYNTPVDATPVTGATASKSKGLDIDVTSAVEQKVSFYVKLKEGINPVTYNAIKDQIVTLTVDWNKGSEIEEITSQTIFFDRQEGWNGETLYAYAYRSTDGKASTDWPGQAMTNVKGGIWSVAIENDYDRVIFNDGNYDEQSAKGGHQIPAPNLEGYVIPASTANTPYYHNGAWTTAPEVSADTQYYLAGTMNEWKIEDTYKFTKLDAGVEKNTHNYNYKLDDVVINAQHSVKVVGDDNVWYNETSNENNAGDVALNAGMYDVYFNPSEAGAYIYFEYVEPTYDTYALDLVEEDVDWTLADAAIFVYSFSDNGLTRATKLASYTELKVPSDATGFVLVRNAKDTKVMVWSGENFFNQSEDLTKGTSTQTLVIKSWADGQDGKSTFAWEK